MSGGKNSSWARTTLGNITAVVRPRAQPQNHPELPFVGMDNVEAHTMRLLGTVPSTTMKSTAVHFQPGDVLYGRLRPYLNKVLRPEFEGLASAEFIPLSTFDGIVPGFLQYRLNAVDFVAHASNLDGGDRPRVDYDQITTFALDVPPFREQRRIVEAIESYFSRLDDAAATLNRVQQNLKRYRASVLQAAVEGRLLPTEAELARTDGREYEHASILLERILAERRRRWEAAELEKMKAKGKLPKDPQWKEKYKEPVPPNTAELPELPRGWCWSTIDQLADVGTGATPKRGDVRFWKNGTIPWVTSSVVNADKVLAPSGFVTSVALAETNLTVYAPGTILVAMYGEGRTRGRAAVLGIPAATNQALAALQLPGTADAMREWLLLFMEYNYTRLRRRASGGVQPNLNLGLIRSIPVPLPPLAEQFRISAEVQKSSSVGGVARRTMEGNAQRLSRLRQSILKWAFEGRLVDQDPSDEPASVLLDRIKAERAAPTNGGARTNRRQRSPRRRSAASRTRS